MKNWVINLVIFFLVASIVIVLVVISMNDLTTNESTLLGVLLTVLSFIASWIVSDFFARKSLRDSIDEVKNEYQNNLRTYALNAAEKVNNLSNELSKLASYLKSELDKDDSSDEYALYSKIERIESSIHIINTLKSVNDTSLSDWKGVIGDELEVREEEKEEREERLLQITENIESILRNQGSTKKKESNEEMIIIKKQLENLEKSLGSTSLTTRNISKKPSRAKVELSCPSCSYVISYSQKEKVNSHKIVKCTNCSKRALSKYSLQDGFYLTPEQIVEETFNCSTCGEILKQGLSNVPFSKEIINCYMCANTMRISRNIDSGITLTTISQPQPSNANVSKQSEITDDYLNLIEKTLPSQPWPTAVHKIVAEELKLKNAFVYRCITELINSGRINPQINGIVYIKSDVVRKENDEAQR